MNDYITKLSDFDWTYANDSYSEYSGGSLNPQGKIQFIGDAGCDQSYTNGPQRLRWHPKPAAT